MIVEKLENVENGEIFFQINEEFDNCYIFSGAYNIKTQIGFIDNIGAIKDARFFEDKNQIVAILEHGDVMPHMHSNYYIKRQEDKKC